MSFLRTPPDLPVAAHGAPFPRTDEPARSDATRHGRFFAATVILYAGLILLGVLTLNPYFAQTWDVTTFIHAASRWLQGQPLDLYAQSRTAQTWPYAYPPLHALFVALALFVGETVRILPDYVWARVPALAADIGIAVLLYAIVERKSGERSLARIAALVWLLNPVTFYDTAVQGHFESEWLFFVLLAYWGMENRRGVIGPAVALALAVLFKQIAILFAIPIWFALAAQAISGARTGESRRRAWLDVGLAGLIFALITGAVCLPYVLYSNDFVYMNLTYVENVPVQTQSWFVALLGLTRAAPDALTSDFFLIRYQTLVTLLATLAIAFWGLRRKYSLYLIATLIAIAFFVTSKKVMGYYYVMLLPFLLVDCVPRRRFDLILLAVVVTTWISLSPYYAGWTRPDHWWIYAVTGSLNTLVFVLFALALHRHEWYRTNAATTVLITLGLWACAVAATLVQPLVQSTASPIRAPVVAPGLEGNAAVALAVMAALVLAALIGLARWTRQFGTVQKWAWLVIVVFAPLFFAVYTLTKESTAIFEMALQALGG